MTYSELRMRLKHVAGLLYGISSDLNECMKEEVRHKEVNEALQTEVAFLKKEVSKLKKNVNARKWYLQQVLENPEVMKAKIKERNEKARAKKGV